jgi:transposase InsO family protein
VTPGRLCPHGSGMARDGGTVEPKLIAAITLKAQGEAVNVAAVCRAAGVSRKTFYKFVARYREEGLDGLRLRSRRPHAPPNLSPVDVEDAVVLARKQLADEGLDNGPISIYWRLVDAKMLPALPGRVPARMTIHRILTRRGMIVPAPRKRPRSVRCRRFTRPRANELWQIDGFEVRLADGTTATVIQLLDDHSRLDLGGRAAVSENGPDVWAAFTTAAAAYGLPAQVLTDNGSAFSGARRGWEAIFETNLRALGVHPITSSRNHPQTCGKNERVHATTERWLAKQPVPRNLGELQSLLDRYRDIYNHRRHQALQMRTPQQVYTLADKTGPAFAPLPPPTRVSHPIVSPRGAIGVDNTEIGLGRRHTGATTTVFRAGDDVTIFIANQLIRTLTIDRRRRYQPRPANP